MTAFALCRSGAKPLRITPARAVDESRLDGVIIVTGNEPDDPGPEKEPDASHQEASPAFLESG